MSVERPIRSVAAGLTVVAMLGLGAGCGVGPDHEATRLADGEVPFELLEKTDEAEVTPSSSEEVAALFFVKGDRLEPVFREVANDASPADVLEVLVSGPTRGEARSGLRSAIAETSRILGVKVSRGVATVDLETSTGDGRSSDQALSVAQVVFTLTSRPGIGRVAFTLDGEPVEVPDGSGALTDDPVAREDYQDLSPLG